MYQDPVYTMQQALVDRECVLKLMYLDFRLPHIRGSLKCPSAMCDTNTKGVESDIIYLKDDQVNLTYLYICSHCNTQWRSRR